MILDGFGINTSSYGNAIALAEKPNLDKYFEKYPSSQIYASGLDVGLPDGQMGNSEVGHLNIGAGRIVYQSLTKITKAIEDGDFFDNEALLCAIENAKKHDSALHLCGLLSDGGVHSHIHHLFGLLKLAKDQGLTKVYIHAFLDGRDVPPSSAASYVEILENKMAEIGIGKIATISGRYYAMDRDNRWERVEQAYNAIAFGEGVTANSSKEAVLQSYDKNEVDEFVKPTVIMEEDTPTATVSENDSIIMFNFRPDRAREITRTFVDENFTGFERKHACFPVHYVCMTQYDAAMPNVSIAYPPEKLVNTLGQYVSNQGLKQLRIAETEKYAHVTFFLSGGVEDPYLGEDRILVPSPKVATYDSKPEMSAYEVTEKLVAAINEEKYDLIIVNYANCDMVGHTGSIDAAKKAVETVDACVGKIVETAIAVGGQILLTADHGNADEMLDKDGNTITAHSTNPVPIILINAPEEYGITEGKLADIAPTLLQMMNLEKPDEITGESLLVPVAEVAEA
nr:2,3-bisphosphoglycerate-independent phosphoglycerate mutase [Marinisporobacter balticus]